MKKKQGAQELSCAPCFFGPKGVSGAPFLGVNVVSQWPDPSLITQADTDTRTDTETHTHTHTNTHRKRQTRTHTHTQTHTYTHTQALVVSSLSLMKYMVGNSLG